MKFKNSDNTSNAPNNALPSPPDRCGALKCNEKTSFLMLNVASGAGAEFRVASEITKTVHLKGNSIITLNDGYNFIAWFARCDYCLTEGIRNKKAKMKLAGEHKYYC